MSGLFITCVEALPIGLPVPPWIRISLPRQYLLGEERWSISQGRRAKSLFFKGFFGFSLHRNTGKAHQSLPGSKDQIIKTYKELQGLILSQGQLAKGL